MGKEQSLAPLPRGLEATFHVVAESIPDAVVLSNESGRIVFWNAGACRMFGYAESEILGRPLTDLMPERLRGDHARGLERFLQTGRSILIGKTSPLSGQRKGGEEFPIELSLGTWVSPEGRFFVGIIRDVSERRMFEMALRDSEERYRHMFENTPFPAWIYDVKTLRFLVVNNAAVLTYGYSREEFLSMTIKDIRPESEIPSLMKNLRATSGVVDHSGGWKHRKKDGTVLDVEISSHGLVFEGKNARLVFVNDVTEQVKAGQAIQRYVDVFGNIQIGLIVYHLENPDDDRTLRLISANPAASLMAGVGFERLVGKTLDENFPYLRARGIPQAYAEVARTGKPWEAEEFAYGDQNVPPGVFSVKAFPLPGHCIGVAFENITERRNAQEKERELYRQLEAANRDLNDFAHIVSHDLKAPLRGINTLAGWLVSDYGDKLDKEGKAQLELLASRVKRMHNLIEGILQYSKAGRTSGPIDTLDLGSLVKEIVDMISPPDSVGVSVETGLPFLIGERTKLFQVFQNLIGNAVKHMDKPYGEVRIGCVEEGDRLRFYVSDNGPGIDPKYFEKIFQIFQTLSSREESDAAGIGLSIVKKIVESLGGRVWVESVVGKGSTFYFELPRPPARPQSDGRR